MTWTSLRNDEHLVLLSHGSWRAFVMACLSSVAVVILFMLDDPRLVHWLVMPVLCCGVLIGLDAWEWLTGGVDLLSPSGIFGVVGYHFFFLAPLLHVHWDFWLPLVSAPPDWRDWLGWAALINAAGLVLYRIGRASFRAGRRGDRRTVWLVDNRSFHAGVAVCLVVTLAVQLSVYAHFGGVAGFIGAFSDAKETFRGMGARLIVGEAFPIIAMIAVAVRLNHASRPVPWIKVVLVLMAFVSLQTMFGGLRGSRSNIVWGVFWAIGLVHLRVRAVPRRAAMGGLVVLLGFMVTYGYYKTYGSRAVGITTGRERGQDSAADGIQRVMTVALGDFGRSDVQAYLLYRAFGSQGDLQYALGKTYLGTAALLVPDSLWPAAPKSKLVFGTEALYGAGVHDPGSFQTSRVFGLVGEAILNFGLVGALLVFVTYGVVMGIGCRFFESLPLRDNRWLLFPFLVSIAISSFVNDSDVVLFALAKNGVVPVVLLLMTSRREGASGPG